MKKIYLSGKHGRNKFALVDNEDFEWLSQHRWHLMSSGYAARAIPLRGKLKFILMHRLIMATKRGFEVDHKDMNKLNNQKLNLRNVTPAQNKTLRPKLKSNTSGFQGVVFAQNKWRAQISVNEKCLFLGQYQAKIEAALAYNEAAKNYFGEFAHLNQI